MSGLRSIVDRILRLKEEQDALGADVREVYAEAKSNGYDKAALGRLVTHLRNVAKKGGAEVAEADTIFDLYLTEYEGSHRPARAHVEIIEESGLGSAEAVRRATAAELPGSSAKESPATNSDDWPEIPAFMRRTA